MIEFLVYRIINNKLSFSNVPTSLKESVKERLISLGYNNLVED